MDQDLWNFRQLERELLHAKPTEPQTLELPEEDYQDDQLT